MTNEATKSKFIFQEGETVLCFHGPLLYEAKCMKAEERDNGNYYLIHYSGWNKSWDEWVPTPRVLKYNDEGLKKQKDLLETHGGRVVNRLGKNPRRTTQVISLEKSTENEKLLGKTTDLNKTKTEDSSRDTRRRRTRFEETKKNEGDYCPKTEVHICLPDELKQILAEDWYNVKNQNKLVNLSGQKTVQNLLDEYLKYKLEKQCDKSIITELVSGVKDYFNSVLSTKLLYKFEKVQFTDTTSQNPSKKYSDIYGAIHFLRLFAKIGELLSYTYWDELANKQLKFNLEDILNYMLENRSKLFSPKDYYNPTLSYIKMSST